MDSVTTAIVTALVQGAIAGVGPTASQAVKDAYAGLKHLIIAKYFEHQTLMDAIEQLESEPGNDALQDAVSQELVALGASQDTGLVEAANSVIELSSVADARIRILKERLDIKLEEVKAIERQIDRTIDSGQRIILERRAAALWAEIEVIQSGIVNRM